MTGAESILLALARIAVPVFIWLGVTAWFWRRRRWLLFYISGALGLVIATVVTMTTLGLDWRLEALEARQVIALASALGMNTELLGTCGLAIENHSGWAVFDIGLECSAILEMAAFTGLVLFYPGFTWLRKAISIPIGVAATYAVNIARILLIVGIIDAQGTDWVFVAHAVFGRVFFFALTVVIYWYIVTRPSVGVVRNQLAAASEEPLRMHDGTGPDESGGERNAPSDEGGGRWTA
jgi:exosortase family protein XrtG